MLLIYTHKITPRIKYIFKLIFTGIYKIKINITDKIEEYESYNEAKIIYSDKKHNTDDLFFLCSEILFQKGIHEPDIRVFNYKDIPVIFSTGSVSALPYDPFSAAFYFASRYEEYLPHIKDAHNRYKADQCLAYRNNFLHIPVVNHYAQHVLELVLQKYPELNYKKPKFKFTPTIDVDVAYAFKDRDIFRTIGGYGLSIIEQNLKKIKQRTNVLLGIEEDPYDTFDYLLRFFKERNLTPYFFFLYAEYAKYDKNISIYSENFKQLIKSLSDNAKIGIHPSYASNNDESLLKKEHKKLSSVVNYEIKHSRQHFLKLTLPDTYRALIELDITDDFTMGYASRPGFRAGICTSYRFYDLDLEYETPLTIHPFTYMEGAFKDYLNLSINDTVKEIEKLTDAVKNVNGHLITLWHNESVSNQDRWTGWRKVFENTIDYALNP